MPEMGLAIAAKSVKAAKLANLRLQDVVNGYLEDTGRILEAEWKPFEFILSTVHRERCVLAVKFREDDLVVTRFEI